MPTIKVPKIELPDIEIPATPYFTQHKLEGQIPGCNLFHRDLQITRNPSLLIADPNGTFTTCPEGQIPSFDPIRFDMNELIYTESSPVSKKKQQQEAKVAPPIIKEKQKEEEPPPCPDLSRVLPVGSFTSDLRTERIKEYKRADNGYDCIPILEEVTFLKSVLPTPAAALNVVAVSFIAASTPLLLPIVKSASKTAFKKIFAKFNKSKKD